MEACAAGQEAFLLGLVDTLHRNENLNSLSFFFSIVLEVERGRTRMRPMNSLMRLR